LSYTKYEEQWIDLEIQCQLDIIIEIIKENISPNNLRSILISGGFGRGEGSIIVEDNQIRPLKDYDIFVIVKKKPKHKLIEFIHTKSYEKLGIENPTNKDFVFSDFVIDINFTTEKRLSLRPDIFSHELKNASKILWGEDIRECIPWSLKDIPTITPLRFLFEKATGLIAHTSDINMKNMEIESDKKLPFIYECYKTYVEICTVLCFSMGCYEPSYERRSILFTENFRLKLPEIHRIIPDLPDKVEKYTQFKLKPDLKQIETENPVELWFKTRDDLLVIMKYFIQINLNMEIKNWNDSYYEICNQMGTKYHNWLGEVILSKLHIHNKYIIDWTNLFIQLVFNWKYVLDLYRKERVLRLKPLVQSYSVIIGTFVVSPLILLAMNKNDVDHACSNEATAKLKHFTACNTLNVSLDYLRDAYLKSYYLYGGPK